MNENNLCIFCEKAEWKLNLKWNYYFCEKCGKGKEQIEFWEAMEARAKEPHIARKMKINKYWKCQNCRQNSYGEIDYEKRITYCIVCNAYNMMTVFQAPINGILKCALESKNIIRKSIIQNNAFSEYFSGLILSKYLGQEFDNNAFIKLRKNLAPKKDIKIGENFYEVTRVNNATQNFVSISDYIKNAIEIKSNKYNNTEEKINLILFCLDPDNLLSQSTDLYNYEEKIVSSINDNFLKHKNIFHLNNSYFLSNFWKREYSKNSIFSFLEKEFNFSVFKYDKLLNIFILDKNNNINAFELMINLFNLDSECIKIDEKIKKIHDEEEVCRELEIFVKLLVEKINNFN